MPRAGRDLEIIVAELEGLLSESTLKVTSPDYIYNHLTEKKEEIDVSISGKFGSHDILILIQCRDRIGPEESNWIGELATQKEGMKANQMVALSSGEFTAPSRKLADKKGIELRNLKSFKPDEIVTWLNTFGVKTINNVFQITGANLGLAVINDSTLPKKIPNIKPDNKIFKYTKDGKTSSLNDIFSNLNNKNNYSFFEKISIGKSPIPSYFKIQITRENPNECLIIEVKKKSYEIKFIELWVLMSRQEKQIPLSEIKMYQKNGENIAEIGIFKGNFNANLDIEFKILNDSNKKKGTKIIFGLRKKKDE